jgi:hypothetical protein
MKAELCLDRTQNLTFIHPKTQNRRAGIKYPAATALL